MSNEAIRQMGSLTRKYMVDGQLLDEHQVRTFFNNGIVDLRNLSSRDNIALRMAAVAAPAGRLLDIGCYAGTFLKQLKILYPNIEALGVDYYEDNIAIARLLHPDLADCFYQMSAYALACEDERFDCVTFREVLEHVYRPVDALREINRVLRVGGHLVLTTPNANARAWRLLFSGVKQVFRHALGRKTLVGHAVFFESVEWNRHIYAWTPATLHTLLLSNGFECVEQQFYCNSLFQRLFPGMADGLAFLVRKNGPSPTHIV